MNPEEADKLVPSFSSPAALPARTAPMQAGSVTPLPIAVPSVPDYEVLKRIGGGSFGDVWLVRSVLGTYRAMKVVYRGSFENDQPFEREFKGIQRFEPVSHSHESQVRILHVGRNQEGDYFYYVMELADDAGVVSEKASAGGVEKADASSSAVGIRSMPASINPDRYVARTLKSDLRRRGRLPADECIQVGLSLATALAHLHSHRLIHRDVKPSNIIFVNGVPKLADIGLVTDVEATRSFEGTQGFIPPEGPGTVQADVYGLGKVLYEMSMGRDRLDFPALPTNWDELPPEEQARLLELNDILLRACATAASQRYQSPKELFADLALLQGGKSVRRLRKIERRLAITTRAGLATAGLLVVAATAYLFAVSQTREAKKERTHAEQLLYAADMSAAQNALDAGNLARATVLLDGQRPRPGREDLRGFEWYYLKNLCHGDEAYTFRGHQAAVRSVAISPDGKLVASGSDDQTIRLWDLLSKTNLVTLREHSGAVNAVAFSSNGTLLASGSADKTVKLWDVATWKVVADLTNASAVNGLAFTPDSKRLIVGNDRTSASLWDIQARQVIREFPASTDLGSLAVSRDGKFLAIGDRDFRVRLWDLSTFESLPPLYEEAGSMWSMTFSKDGQMLATARSDGVFLWDMAQRRVADKLKGHEAEVHCVRISPDGKILASAAGDNTIRLWDMASGLLIRILKGHREGVWTLDFSPDGQTLISGGWDDDIKLWELSPKTELGVLCGHTDSVKCVAFSLDDRVLASASHDGTIKLWDVSTGSNTATINGHTGAVTGVVFSGDGATLASCGLDGTVRFWDSTTGQQLGTFSRGKRLSCLALSPDGKTLAAGSGWWTEIKSDAEISFWEMGSRQELPSPVSIHEMVQNLSFSPDGKTLAVGTVDECLVLIEVKSRRTLYVSTNFSSSVAWSLADGTLAVSDDADPIAMFDINQCRISRRLQMPSVAMRYMACSPDGRTMAIFYTTTLIKLCNVVTGREVATLRGHEGFGVHLAFSHDGRILASAGNDRTVRLWRAPRNNTSGDSP